MVNNGAVIPTTHSQHSPSITQETKARFHQLLNAALSKELSEETKVFKNSLSVIPSTFSEQPEFVPKPVPRKKHLIKSTEGYFPEKHGNSGSIYSSPESFSSRTIQRQVIAEVHSSQTRLLLSSSDDDILSEKKEKKKRKRSKYKQASQPLNTEGEENVTFQPEDNHEKNSPSRLSSRSYTVETPTFPISHIQSLTARSHEGSISESNVSPSLSRRSYTIETSVLPDSSAKKAKTPVPLPRRKSLKSISNLDESIFLKSTPNADEVTIEGEQVNNSVTLFGTAPQGFEGDLGISVSAAVELQGSVEHTEDDGEMPLAVRKHKRKKRRGKLSKSREQMELIEISPKRSNEAETVEETMTYNTEGVSLKSDTNNTDIQHSGEQVVGVTIHGVDCALIDPLARHPVVRLHIVDTSTGEYYKKSDSDRSVCYFEESVDYILPIMTHPFHFKLERSLRAQWEECLLINENFSHLLSTHTLLLFELSDFLPASQSAASSRHRKLGSSACWHILAWAFLRPMTSSGPVNVGSWRRLQLYKPAKHPKALRSRTPAVYEWWGSAVRHKYPGCLDVTVAPISPSPRLLSPQLRSQTALQSEQGSAAASVAASEINSDNNSVQEEKTIAEEVRWSRLPAQSCKVPNHRLHSLPVDGSMCLEFSGCGLWLACGRQDVTIFSVPQFLHTATLSSHQGLIYCLRWSADSKVLLSASADCTICVWQPRQRKAPLLQMLAHPSFVYCVQFIPTQGYCTLVSGCYDGLLRLWQGQSHSSYQLAQELCSTASNSYITAVCVTTDGTRVISADNQGFLRIYEVDEDGRLSGGRELRVREVRGKTVSNIVAHPGGHRLLLQTRDSLVRSVDIATGAVIQTLKGNKNERLQTGMCVSPCGSLVFACGEDGSVAVWDGHTGSLRAIYLTILPPGSAAVHYHPYEHLLVVASLAQPPVQVLAFSRTASGEEVGLHFVDSESVALKTITTMEKSSKWQQTIPKVTQNSVCEDVNEKKKSKRKDIEKYEFFQESSSSKWPCFPQLESYISKTSDDKDLHLLEIIKRMDTIILAAKQSSQTT